jgi:lipopolysaccharide export system permease protein
LRARRIDKANSRLYEVVIYDFGDGTKRRTIVADSGDLSLGARTGDLTLLLYHGSMTEIPAATPTQLTRLFFTTDRITRRGVANSFSRDSADSYKSEREMGVCEMQSQVYGAERDLYRERRSAAQMQSRALKALTRGIVDTLRPVDSLRTASPGIGRYYCAATAFLGGFFGGGDSTIANRGQATTDAVTASPTIAPIVNPNDQAAATVPAGVSQTATAQSGPAPAIAPSAGVTINTAPQSLLPISQVTASQASTGIGPIIEQAVQRSAIARSTWSQYEVEIHKKFSLAVACVVFVLLGAPIALRFPRGGVGLVIGASLAVFSLYYICLIAGESMADDGVLPPWLAMWAANGVFTIVGVVLYLRMGREGSTARGGDLDDVKDRISAWFASLRPSARRPAPVPATDS